MAESSVLLSARLTLGDERVARALFEQEYDAGFASRHSNQLAGLWKAEMERREGEADDE